MIKKVLLAAAVCLSLASAAAAQQKQPAKPPAPPDPHAGHGAPAQPTQEPTVAAKYFTDVELLDQDGKKVRFYTDVLKGKTVVVNAFFTTCTSVCPPMNRSFEKIQEALGDRLGKDVFLVSLTVDPATDTPARLKEYAAKFHARPGWAFLTGKKALGMAKVEDLIQIVESVANDKGVAAK